jgi:hypothetical protein
VLQEEMVYPQCNLKLIIYEDAPTQDEELIPRSGIVHGLDGYLVNAITEKMRLDNAFIK